MCYIILGVFQKQSNSVYLILIKEIIAYCYESKNLKKRFPYLHKAKWQKAVTQEQFEALKEFVEKSH